MSQQKTTELQQEILDMLLSDEYTVALDALIERKVAKKCQRDLGATLKNVHRTRDTSGSEGNSRRTSLFNSIKDPNLDRLRSDLRELQLELTEVEMQKQLAMTHRGVAVKTILTRVEEINDFMKLLSLDYVDLEQLKTDLDLTGLEDEEDSWKKKTRPVNTVNDRPKDYFVDSPSKGKKRFPVRHSKK
jgi:hypothetical protein